MFEPATLGISQVCRKYVCFRGDRRGMTGDQEIRSSGDPSVRSSTAFAPVERRQG